MSFHPTEDASDDGEPNGAGLRARSRCSRAAALEIGRHAVAPRAHYGARKQRERADLDPTDETSARTVPAAANLDTVSAHRVGGSDESGAAEANRCNTP